MLPLLAVLDTIQPLTSRNANIGDLILTDGGLFFIAYHEFEHEEPAFVHAAVGGLAFVGMQKMIVSMDDANARRVARLHRDGAYGSTIEERMVQYPKSIHVPTDRIDGLAIADDLSTVLVRMAEGDSLYFIIPKLPEETRSKIHSIFQKYPRGREIAYDANDPLGLLTGRPSPPQLAEDLLSNSPRLDANLLGWVSTQREYVTALYAHIKIRAIEGPESVALRAKNWPLPFRDALQRAAVVSRDRLLARVRIGMAVFLFCAVSMAVTVLLGWRIRQEFLVVMSGVLFSFFLIAFGLMLYIELRQYRWDVRLLETLNSK